MSAWIQMISDDDASKELLKLLKLARTPHGAVDSVMRPPANDMVIPPYSAAAAFISRSRRSFAICLLRSNSARRLAISSSDICSILLKSNFQLASSLQRSGDCTVVRGPIADSRTFNASSIVKACDLTSLGFPAAFPSGKSLKRKRGAPTCSTMSLAQPMITVGMPFSSR